MTAATEPAKARAVRHNAFVLSPAAAAILAAMACAIPILAHPHLPLVDLPNHIARLHVAASDLSAGPLARYYDYALSIVPNSAADLAWHVVGQPGDPVRFAQGLMVFYAVNLIAGAMVLGRVVHGRWTAWPAAAGMMAYSAPFLWGFQNFVLSVPFVLHGLALWLGTEGRRDAIRLAVMIPFALALFLMHFFGFAILAIAVFGREAQIALTGRAQPWGRRMAVATVRMVPFILPTIWLAYDVATAPPSALPSDTAYGSLWHAAIGAVSPFYSQVLGGPLMNGAGVIGALILCAAILEMVRRRGIVTLDVRMVGPVAALTVAALCTPFLLNGVAWVQIRVPVALAVLLVAGSRLGPLAPRQAALLGLAVAAVMLGRGIALERHAERQSQEVANIVAIGSLLPPDARVLPLRAPGPMRAMRTLHLQAYLVTHYDVFIPTLFLGTHTLRVHDAWREHAHYAAPPIGTDIAQSVDALPQAPVFIQDWRAKYTHVVLLDPPPEGVEEALGLALIGSSGGKTLYAIEGS